MKKLLFAMTALSALAAFPAAAQYSSQSNVNAGSAMSFNSRIAQLETRMQAGIQSGAISRSEAISLRRELRALRRLERQYSVNGLTQQERAALQARIRDFRSDLRLADGRGGRDDRYGWDDDDVDTPQSARVDRNNDGWDDRDYDRDGRWEDDVQGGSQSARVDRNNDGWDDRDYDRDGQWEDDVNRGQGGPYEEASDACENRSVVGGLIDSVLGRQECSLRVGQRATGNLSAVPYEYRSRFRDGNGVYYRSDGRSIYQIDARTDTVVRIYSMNR